MHPDYLEKVLNAQVYDIAVETPLDLAGNHAQGVALSAAKIGCRAVIVMPETTPAIKVDAVRRRGGEVVLAGSSYDDAYAKALELEKAEKLTFVHPFDDPEVIAGQATASATTAAHRRGLSGGGLMAPPSRKISGAISAPRMAGGT